MNSCTVVLTKACNHATTTPQTATSDATDNATYDLVSLAKRILERNKRNQPRNFDATEKLHSLVTEELRSLIRQCSINYGGDDEEFLSKYIEEIITNWSHNLDSALKYFREVVKQIAPVKNRRFLGDTQ